MTDFLTRMAQRSRGEADVIAPRVPGLFGPTQETDFAVADNTNAIEPVIDTRPAPRPNDLASPATQTRATADAADTEHLLPTAGTQVTGKTADTDARSAKRPEQPLDVRDAPAADTARPAVEALVRSHEIPLHAPVPASETTLPRSSEASQDASAADRIMPLDATSDRIQAADTNASTRPLPLVAACQNPQPSPQQLLAERLPVQTPVDRQEPAVHINIGRVEVRAHTPGPDAAPKPVRHRPEKGLSLNDYLKRGDGRS